MMQEDKEPVSRLEATFLMGVACTISLRLMLEYIYIYIQVYVYNLVVEMIEA